MASLWLLSAIRVAVVPGLVAVLVAAALQPLASRLENVGLPRSIAAGLPIAAIIAVFVMVAWFIGDRTASELTDTEFQTEQVRAEVERWLMSEPFGLERSQIDQAEESIRTAMIGGAREWGADQGTLVFTLLGGGLLGLVLSFLLTKDGPRMWQWAVRRSHPARREPFDRAGRAASRTMAVYLRSVMIAGVFDATLIGIGLWIIGVPLIMPLVMLTAIAALFPVVGAFVAGLAAAVVALVTLGVQEALWVVALTLLIQQVEGNIVVPMLVGKQASIHPSIVLVALTAGGAVAGLAGAFLAVPIVGSIISAVSAFNDTAAVSDVSSEG